MIHLRFKKSEAFAKRKDVSEDEQLDLTCAVPDDLYFRATYEALRVGEGVLAGWDQNRGAWVVPVTEDLEPSLTLEGSVPERELLFSDVEFYWVDD